MRINCYSCPGRYRRRACRVAKLTTAELDAVDLPLQSPDFVVVVAATLVALYGAAVIVYVLLRKVTVIVSPPGGLVSDDAPGVLLSA